MTTPSAEAVALCLEVSQHELLANPCSPCVKIQNALDAHAREREATLVQQIESVAMGQLTYCDPDAPCEPGECWGCDVFRVLDRARAAKEPRV